MSQLSFDYIHLIKKNKKVKFFLIKKKLYNKNIPLEVAFQTQFYCTLTVLKVGEVTI